MLVSGDHDNTLRVWNPNNNYILVTLLTGHTNNINSLLQLSNGILVSGSLDTMIKVWTIPNNPDSPKNLFSSSIGIYLNYSLLILLLISFGI